MEVSSLLLGLFVMFMILLTLRWFFELFEIENLENKAIFITGCDSGFGRALAIYCAEHGLPVMAGCMLKKSIDELQTITRNCRTPINAFILDVTSDESVAEAKNYVERNTEKYGGLHGVVNNAGVLGNAFFDDFLNIEDYKKTADVNLWGAIRIAHAFKPLVKRTRGRLIITTSICSRIGLMGTGPYTVSKFALSGYCDIIRSELRLFGVSVHVLEPGFFSTHLTSRKNVESQLDTLYNRCPDAVKLEYGKEFFFKMQKKSLWLLGLVSSKRINQVTEAYYHALTAVHPRARYHVGWDSIFLFTPLTLLPTELQDLFVRIISFITNIPTPLASQKIR